MSQQTITKAFMYVEIDGKCYSVLLSQDRMLLLTKMASGLADNGKLNVSPLPDDFKFVSIDNKGNILEESDE